MKELFDLGISESTLKAMMELNPEINELSNEEILEKINILEIIDCSKLQILNIISSNSLYLSKTKGEIIKLINYLKQIGFKCLNILIDSNPYILNLELFEIESYINKKINDGENVEDIIDELDSNPSLFLEM